MPDRTAFCRFAGFTTLLPLVACNRQRKSNPRARHKLDSCMITLARPQGLGCQPPARSHHCVPQFLLSGSRKSEPLVRISSPEISGLTGLLVLALTLCSGFFTSTNAQDVPAAQSSGSGPGAWNFQIVDHQSAKSLADETATQNAPPVHGANYTFAMLYPPFAKTIGFNNLSYLAEVSPTSPATIAAG